MIVSLASWAVIFRKLFGLKRVRAQRRVRARLLVRPQPERPVRPAPPSRATAPLERIFASGMREFLKLRERRLDAGTLLDGARRAMRAS